MSNENNANATKKPRATRTPRNAETITKGALELELSERIALVKTLKESIQREVETYDALAKKSATLAEGL